MGINGGNSGRVRHQFDDVSKKVIGCAIEVHRTLGPGLLESIYQKCLCKELDCWGIRYQSEVQLPIQYKDLNLESGYRIDLLVERTLILELKSVREIEPIHQAQLLTYMKLAGLKTGILLNFNVTQLRAGITRMVL